MITCWAEKAPDPGEGAFDHLAPRLRGGAFLGKCASDEGLLRWVERQLHTRHRRGRSGPAQEPAVHCAKCRQVAGRMRSGAASARRIQDAAQNQAQRPAALAPGLTKWWHDGMH
jgi:hypothetical protein